MTKENQIEMGTKAITWIFDMLKAQGVSFALLALAVWFLNSKLEAVERKNEDCNNQMIQMYKTISISNQATIEKNTLILEKIERKLD